MICSFLSHCFGFCAFYLLLHLLDCVMSLAFVRRLRQRSVPLTHFSHLQLSRFRYSYQMQAENARKMLTRKDGRTMTTHEIQAIFKNIGTILDDVSKDPKGYTPTDIDGTEELMSNLRQIRLEYAPDQLAYLSANFLMWFHSFYAKKVYADLHHISVQYDIHQKKKENEFNKFSQQMLKWSTYLTSDMEIVWDILNEIDIAVLAKEGGIEDEEEMMKIIRNLRTNAALHIEDYSGYLLKMYDDIMAFSKSINFLEFDEAQLALTASPFLGKFDVCSSLIDRLATEKERECKRDKEVLLDKVLDLPCGLNWFNLYKMYQDCSKYKEIISQWEDSKLVSEQQQSSGRNRKDLCWFKMDDFRSSILKIDVYGNDADWSELRSKYLDSEYIAECDQITMNNSLIKRMGNTAQIICLLGSEQSIFGESILHLTGLWLSNFENSNGDGDRVLVSGRNMLQMNEERYLVHEEEWDLSQTYSLSEDVIYLAGICYTEQRIQSSDGDKLDVPNVPNLVRIKTQIQMTLNRQ